MNVPALQGHLGKGREFDLVVLLMNVYHPINDVDVER
jgi:hypothetical protein